MAYHVDDKSRNLLLLCTGFNAPCTIPTGFTEKNKKSGGVLLSHDLAAIVSSALKDLTSVFEMGTGIAPSASPPETDFLISLP
jgi:hypothetical protein